MEIKNSINNFLHDLIIIFLGSGNSWEIVYLPNNTDLCSVNKR